MLGSAPQIGSSVSQKPFGTRRMQPQYLPCRGSTGLLLLSRLVVWSSFLPKRSSGVLFALFSVLRLLQAEAPPAHGSRPLRAYAEPGEMHCAKVHHTVGGVSLPPRGQQYRHIDKNIAQAQPVLVGERSVPAIDPISSCQNKE